MSLLEILTIHLGAAIAKSVLRFWLQDTEIAKDFALSTASILEKKIPDFLARRRTEQQFSRMSDDIATNLAVFFEKECTGIPENELSAAAIAVSDAITKANIGPSILFCSDLDPLQLEKFIRSSVPNMARDLSEGGLAAYDICLRESCNYIVEIYITLPDFSLRQTQEFLRRDSEIILLVRKVLEQLPKLQEQLDGLPMPDKDFERQYRREVARNLNWLELFGVDLPPSSKRYALSVGYITLTASCKAVKAFDDPAKADSEDRYEPKQKTDSGLRTATNESRNTKQSKPEKKGKKSDELPDDDEIYVRVDEALKQNKRIVIRGEAGSGKTTLLQWLAVQSAQQSFVETLENWNGAVPFFIQLRRYVDTKLPAPEEFTSYVGRNSAGEMPKGWIHRQLRSGNALVLVDGVDELPDDRRDDAKRWLVQLVEEFGSSRFIVTSRPPAVGQNWLGDVGFEDSELQPMALSDIDAFIDHWHKAAAPSIADSNDSLEVNNLKMSLKQVIRDNRPIRILATTPLLCAMLCALNKNRMTKLPKDRMELYRIALEMLIDRRDLERDVPSVEEQTLTSREKQILLQDFAYWLLKNGHSDIDISSAAQRFSKRLSSMPNVSSNDDGVFQYLLLRSGILRQPIEGRVDFIHRTFEEYLGAKEAIDEGDIGFLVRNSHLDSWKEVIILAVGHASKRQRNQLVSGLIEKGSRDLWHRHKIHLLAVACLETSPELDPEITSRLGEILHSLIPPTTKSEARALASAGDLAVPLLSGQSEKYAIVVAACVRALSLIGTEKAMNVLKEYGSDTRVTVTRELKRAWSSFDAERFAKEVLADCPFEYGKLSIESVSLLPGVRHLKKTNEVHCRLPENLENLAIIRGLSQLTHLRISGCRKVDDLSDLRTLENLRSLNMRGCTGVREIGTLSEIDGLVSLNMSFCSSISQIAGLSKLERLQSLYIGRCSNIEDFSEIGRLSELEFLNMEYNRKLSDIGFLANLSKLKTVILRGCNGIISVGALSGLSRLEYLSTSFCRSLEDLSGLTGLGNLKRIRLTQCNGVTDFSALESVSNIRSIVLSRCGGLYSLPSLVDLKSLDYFDLENCKNLTDISSLAEAEKLRTLDISGCENIGSLDALSSLSSLRWLSISGCRNVVDLSPLAAIPNLRYLHVGELGDQAIDLTPLSERSKLTIVVDRTENYRHDKVKFRPVISHF